MPAQRADVIAWNFHGTPCTEIFSRVGRASMVVAVTMFCAACAGVPALEVLRSSPAAGAVLDAPPRDVRIWFDAAPEVEGAELAFEGPAGDASVRMLHTMGEQDLMAFVIGEMPDGRYRLTWRALSPDGEVATGEIPFAIRRPVAAGD